MKKLIIKTAIITFGVTIIAAISLFGIVSFCAPAAMMRLMASIGLDGISADYAYQEYSRTEDISYLARSLEVAAQLNGDRTTSDRFDEFIAAEGFEEYCKEQDRAAQNYSPKISYRNYIFSIGVKAKYRLARTMEEKQAIYREIALKNTESAFPLSNPVSSLCLEAAKEKDRDFCIFLIAEMENSQFEKTENFNQIKTILEEAAHE